MPNLVAMKLFIYFALLCGLSAYCQDIETLSWKTTTMNDRIALTVPLKEFQKMGREADSITDATSDDLCGLKNMQDAKLYYFKGVKYILHNDTLTFRSVDFSPRRRMYLATEKDWFDHTTTFKNFAKTYPGSAAYPDYLEDEEGGDFDMYTMLPEEAIDKSEWRFYFREGKLHHIEYWSPCE